MHNIADEPICDLPYDNIRDTFHRDGLQTQINLVIHIIYYNEPTFRSECNLSREQIQPAKTCDGNCDVIQWTEAIAGLFGRGDWRVNVADRIPPTWEDLPHTEDNPKPGWAQFQLYWSYMCL
jgi:hypothetical protein